MRYRHRHGRLGREYAQEVSGLVGGIRIFSDRCLYSYSTEIVNIMGHSRAGEITHDVSHYFHPATPKQRLAHHMNTSKALTNPTLEQIMISDHPPFTKRNEDLNFAVAKGSPNFSEAKANKGTEFVDFVRVVSRVMGRPFQQNDEGDAGGTPIREGDPGLLKGSQDDRAMWYLSPRASHAREHHFHS